MGKLKKRRIYVSGYIDVEMSDEDFKALVDRLEEEGTVDVGDIRGVDVATALDTADLEASDVY